MSAAGTRSQAGMRARVYCLQAALQMACLSQNNLSMCLPTWTCWDVLLCYLWVRRVHCSCCDGSSSWYLPKILEGWKINLGAYTLALCIGCLSIINILVLEMIQVDEIGEGLVAYHTHHWCLRPWIPADPHGGFVMSLLEFQSPYWEHLDLSNRWIWSVYGSQVTMTWSRSLWGWILVIRISGQIGQLGERDFLGLSLVCWKSAAVSCTWLKSLLLCHALVLYKLQ